MDAAAALALFPASPGEVVVPTVAPKETSPKRFSPSWRLVPGLITLVALVIAIITVLVLNLPYLAIPFGVGLLASAYSTYQAARFGNLKDLEQTNLALEKQVEALKKHELALERELEALTTIKTSLEAEVRSFKSANAELGGNVQTFSALNEAYAKENRKLSSENADLVRTVETGRETAAKLERALERSEQERDAQLRALSSLKESLARLEQSLLLSQGNNAAEAGLLSQMRADHGSLSAKLAETQGRAAETLSGFQKVLGEIEELVYASRSKELENLIQRLSNSEEAMGRAVRHLAALHEQHLSVMQQTASLQGEHAEQLRQSAREHNRLERVRTGLQETEASLREVTNRLASGTQKKLEQRTQVVRPAGGGKGAPLSSDNSLAGGTEVT